MFRTVSVALRLWLGTMAAVACAGALAAYPEKPVQIIVPYAAGGGGDIVSRALARTMSEVSGHQFIVVNKPGAGGNIGTNAVARARGDGYMLLLASPATHGINPFLYQNPGYDPLRDFEPVALIGHAAVVLFANSEFPARTLADVIELARQSPGLYPYGSPGTGSPHQLAMEQLKLQAKLDLPSVPYKGAGPAMVDLVGGRIPLAIGSLGTAARYLEEGRIRIIAAANTTRLPSARSVPLFAETVPGLGVGSWVGLVAPAGTPRAAIGLLSDTLQTSLRDPKLVGVLEKTGFDVDYRPPAAFGKLISDELDTWKALVEGSGAKPD